MPITTPPSQVSPPVSIPLPHNSVGTPHLFDVRAFGARGDGVTLDHTAINGAIAAAADAGGGTVVVSAGDYLCYSIRLRSSVTLKLEAGATLIAADPPPAGQAGGYDTPEDGPVNLFQDFGHSRFRNSLIWGEELDAVSIVGPGRIFGRGLSRGNGRIASPVGIVAPQPPGRLPDVLEADGPVEPVETPHPGPFGYPHGRDTLPAGVGNKAVALRGCRNVTLRDLTILHGGHFAVLATACDTVTIDNLLIDTNRDGIDIDGCSNVRVSRCSVNSPWDDGICIKSSFGAGVLRPAENITVSDCYVSGFEEGSLYDGRRSRVIRHRGGPIGRIKLGTEGSGGYRNIAITNCVFEYCRGLALEQVDGGVMEDIVVTNLTMRDIMNAPIFVRVGARLRSPTAAGPLPTNRIVIAHVVASAVASEHGIFIAGLESAPVNELSLSDIRISYRGGNTAGDALGPVPELPTDYPEPYLFGTLPAWGFNARHATGLSVRALTIDTTTPDARPAVWLDDVRASEFDGVRTPRRDLQREDWRVVGSRGVILRGTGGTDLGSTPPA